MDNVIAVNFRAPLADQIPIQFSYVDQVADNVEAYLDSLRAGGLDEDDVLDVADAIASYDVYEQSDDVIQAFADTFNSQYL